MSDPKEDSRSIKQKKECNNRLDKRHSTKVWQTQKIIKRNLHMPNSNIQEVTFQREKYIKML
jgi:hypothetical protein